MKWSKEKLDLILVPVGISTMIIYHLILLYRFKYLPKTTMNGYENHCKRQWVTKMMSLEAKDRSLAITVCNSHVSAATSLSSISLVLSSLIGAWLGGSSTNIYTSGIIYGDTRPATMSVKYISLLCCFLIAFACFVQTTRCFVHASFLFSMPDCVVPDEYVKREVILGSNFWSVGVRALYFAMTLLLWVFGPIPMVVSSVVMVVVLNNLDSNKLPLRTFKNHCDEKPLERIGNELSDMNKNLEENENENENGNGKNSTYKNRNFM